MQLLAGCRAAPTPPHTGPLLVWKEGERVLGGSHRVVTATKPSQDLDYATVCCCNMSPADLIRRPFFPREPRAG